jgi:hypothetical protein
VATTAGGRSGIWIVVFNQPAVADRAASMICFPQAWFVIVFLLDVAFQAAEFFTLAINEFTGLVVLQMVTDAASTLRQRFSMNFMGEPDRRPAKLAKNIPVGQVIFSLLRAAIRPNRDSPQN